ncbi:inactive protein RESTRICTED TEV MOVEMENT 2-like [Durio zibethinus]|uniref:Inactive protein RESTRICTED TEV MOVEMENT 2-like n=1 Tax=Durio zibethinus TaxID=66656 RepID=A0A6P5Z539_DURZI|nr:inactive protein RESTRICTED TEV MOVEMENT 2-like [Durio zibethinus]
MDRSYIDFEPDYQYRDEEAHDIIEFQVKDFRKEQLKVQLSSNGVLTVCGERPSGRTRWIRFRKEFNAPKECKANDFRVRLRSGIPYIKIPKRYCSADFSTGCTYSNATSLIANSRRRQTKSREQSKERG